MNGNFTGLGLENETRYSDKVADVHFLERFIFFFAYAVARNVALNVAFQILNIAERRFAHDTFGHKSAGDGYGLLVEFVKCGFYLPAVVIDVEFGYNERVFALTLEFRQLFAAYAHLFAELLLLFGFGQRLTVDIVFVHMFLRSCLSLVCSADGKDFKFVAFSVRDFNGYFRALFATEQRLAYRALVGNFCGSCKRVGFDGGNYDIFNVLFQIKIVNAYNRANGNDALFNARLVNYLSVFFHLFESRDSFLVLCLFIKGRVIFAVFGKISVRTCFLNLLCYLGTQRFHIHEFFFKFVERFLRHFDLFAHYKTSFKSDFLYK